MVKIQNLTNRLVSLRLNNGKTLHLPPHMVSAELIEAQVARNDKVAKLREHRIIALSESQSRGVDETSRGRAPRSAKASKSPAPGNSTKEGE